MVRLGVVAHQWHAVFHAALTRSEVVGVKAAVRAYLRREPTRAEMNAARRAVASFSEAEPADVYHVPVSGVRMLLLARPGVEVDAAVAERAVTRQIRPSQPRQPDAARLLKTIERGVETAAEAARHMAVADVNPRDAADAAAVLAGALPDLTAVRKCLERRSVAG